jgi:hypothetical protein
MNRVLVRYLLWILIAALPLQGFAAAVNICCGQTRAVAAHSIDETDLHHMHSAGDVDMEKAGHSAKAGDAAHSHGKGSTCSHCASCCLSAAALPSNPVLAQVFLTSPAVVLAPAPLVTGFIPDGLERPPRAFSA